MATFVGVEQPKYNAKDGSNEGIYEMGFGGSLRDEYYAGVSSSPGEPFSSITRGMRREYSLDYQSQPMLYFSPVDGRLHLLGAQQGVYNVDNVHEVKYSSLAGDGHIDSWQLYNASNLTGELVQFPGQLLYAANDTISVVSRKCPAGDFSNSTANQLRTVDEAWPTAGRAQIVICRR